MWQFRTAALGYAPDQLTFTSNARRGWRRDPPIPDGFYGVQMDAHRRRPAWLGTPRFGRQSSYDGGMNNVAEQH
ncbi:hypothetical protein PR202_ga06833 [Eleusine coracana subsp. coracana]|uniref:Uncharacterized protein n=1 Tax=Eleusine coracana subsp. coracana TaxID=191504 RepID=A0AAV5BXR9_ELECO|nr:hypothetical protein PR202_ga06833 [Eleusine coracana subsp. coracana]